MTCLVFDGHQAGSDDDDVQLAESAGPFPTMVVEEVEDEDEEEDRSESYPDNRDRVTNQVGPSDKILHPRTEMFSSVDLLLSDVKSVRNFLMSPRVSWPRLARSSRLLGWWRPITI